MRADRLVRLILLLQRHGRLTADQLAQRLEVSGRTILRDIEALSAAGVPVYADRGASGGFRLLDGYHVDLSGLRVPELRTLLLGGRAGLLHDLGWTQEAAAAQDKLRHALSARQLTQADAVNERILIDDGPWFAGARQLGPVIAQLLSAVWQNHRVAVTYTHPGGTAVHRRLAPYALVAKAGVWYVVAERDDTLRVYRLDRMAEVTRLDEAFDRVPTFDLRYFWTEWTHAFEASRPRFLAQLAVSPAIYAEFLRATPWTMERVAEPDHTNPDYRLTMVFEDLTSAVRHIISFMPDVRALDPVELRRGVTRAARRIGTWVQEGGRTLGE